MNVHRSIIGLVVIALLGTSVCAVLAGNRCGKPCASPARANAAGASCPSASAASCEGPGGKIAGRFDVAMSGVCRFACGTKPKRDPRHYSKV
jgi:hypothetical protein